MKKILVVLAVMALPQVVGLSTVCNAGGRTACSSNPDGSCVLGVPCGAYSSGSFCTTIANPAWVAAAKKAPTPRTTQFLCECR